MTFQAFQITLKCLICLMDELVPLIFIFSFRLFYICSIIYKNTRADNLEMPHSRSIAPLPRATKRK